MWSLQLLATHFIQVCDISRTELASQKIDRKFGYPGLAIEVSEKSLSRQPEDLKEPQMLRLIHY